MTRSEIETASLESFEHVVGVPPSRGLATTPADVPEWRSLNQVYLLAHLESRLGVDLDPAAFTFGGSIGELCDAVEAACRA